MGNEEYAASAEDEDCYEESDPREVISQEHPASSGPKKKVRKHREKVSWVWQYFIKDGDHAVCQFCETSFAFSSTTTLSYHLNHVHKNMVSDESPSKINSQHQTKSGLIHKSTEISNAHQSPKSRKNLSLPNNFLKETAVLISNVLDKPAKYCVVKVVSGSKVGGHSENRLKSGSTIDEPERKKTRKQREKISWVWQYFLKEGTMASCKFCQASLSSASTTTLSYHLNHLHKELLTNQTSTSDSNLLEPQISDFSRLTRLKITTNVSKSNIPSNFLKEISSLTSEVLDKPEDNCIVSIVPDQMMLWGGQEGPCVFVQLASKGKLDTDQSKNCATTLGKHIEENLGVIPSRLCFEYQDITSSIDHFGL